MDQPAYKTPRETRMVISELMLPSHSNFSGKIHGGYILHLLDQIAFACASKHSGNYCVTASVDKVNFIQPIEVGELVTMKASVNYTGRTSMVIGIRVEAENIQTGVIKHCNSSYFTMVAKDELGKNAAVPGLKLEYKQDVRRFVERMRKKDDYKRSEQEFDAKTFDIEKYLGQLEGLNTVIELKTS
ncbi:acyl-CoA thioesterase [Gangjinia marincola]|uniref:Acyl-CoA thioesterase n=1 Tax=Gangjinia marincola TaxID=578463 RepID=A0ABN1MFH8_9FLAO